MIGLASGSGTDTEFKQMTCSIMEQVGWWVYNSSSDACRGAVANDLPKSHVIGLIIKKTSATQCIVQTRGYTTVLGGLSSPEIAFLSETVVGGTIFTIPTAPGSVIKQLGYATKDDNFLIDINPSGIVLV